jgi:hypothetical protein
MRGPGRALMRAACPRYPHRMTYSRLLSRTLPCVLATAALIAACSRADFDPEPDAGGDLPDAGGIVSDGGPADGPASEGGTTVPVLCDGSTSIRFAYQVAGGGPVLPPSEVLYENGFTYLLVDGACHYWVLQDVYQEVREGDLSAPQAASLASDLRLGLWSSLPLTGSRAGCFDAPSAVLRFGDDRYVLPSACGPTDAGAATALATRVRGYVEKLYGGGTAVTGPVRYVLVSQDVDWGAAVQAQAKLWPLMDLATSVALTSAQAYMYQRGSARLASADAAASLRNLRNASATADVRALTGGYLPVVDEDGGRYQLYVRDAIPLETAQGLLPLF